MSWGRGAKTLLRLLSTSQDGLEWVCGQLRGWELCQGQKTNERGIREAVPVAEGFWCPEV